jgi:arylsulfatase A-like enzyme
MPSTNAALWLAALLLGSACTPGDHEEAPRPAPTSDAHAQQATPRPRRIILFSMDTVRADRVAGYSAADTPAIRKIADQGVLFRDFYAASTYTLPSHMTMMTGLMPLEHGVVNEMSKLALDVPSLASLLAAAGYSTHSFNEGGYVDARFGFDRGFDEYDARKNVWTVDTGLWAILEWIRSQRNEPYFLFLHTYAAHYPYGGFRDYRDRHPERGLPSDRELEQLRITYHERGFWQKNPAARELPAELQSKCTMWNALRDTGDRLECGGRLFSIEPLRGPHLEMDLAALRHSYDERIRKIDRAIGQIHKLLVELGQWQDTLFVITSDHGESFFEHGRPMHDYSPFNEVLKVPLVISYPRRLPTARVIDGLSWHLDLMPSLLGLAGVEPPPGLRGLDLTPILLGSEAIPEDRAIFPLLLRGANRFYAPMRRIVLQKDYKYIDGDERLGDPEGFLFDLAESPDESENLRARRPREVARLRGLISDYERRLRPGSPVHQKTGEPVPPYPGRSRRDDVLDDEVRAKLEALGYLTPMPAQ